MTSHWHRKFKAGVLGVASGERNAVMMEAAPGHSGVCGMAMGGRLGAGQAITNRDARSFSSGDGGRGSL